MLSRYRYFSKARVLWDGPLEKLWGEGAGEIQKKFMKGKIECTANSPGKKFLHTEKTEGKC